VENLLQTYQKIQKVIKNPETLNQLTEQDKRSLLQWLSNFKYEWELHARTEQIPPGGIWTTWLVLAGRGFGKTRLGSEAIRRHVHKQGYKSIGLIGPTAADARDTMIDGKGGSSLLEITPESENLQYFPTKRKLMWGNGAIGSAFSAEEPERLRGPQHDLIWSDELAAWRYLQETWDMAMFGLRLGKNPRHVITTTPKPLPILKELVSRAVPASEMKDGMVEDVVVTRGSTMDNRDNLAPQFIEVLMKKYEGTRLGRQELYAEILDDNPNALFKQEDIDLARVEVEEGVLRPKRDVKFRFVRGQGVGIPQTFTTVFDEIVVAVDPAMSSNASSDETGIIVAAVDRDARMYVLEDASGIYSPNEWARVCISLYLKYGASRIVAEVNQGGDLVENTIRTVEKEMSAGKVEYKKVRAAKGKVSRAEPVGALSEQRRLHHVGDFPKLEDQLVSFAPGYMVSPDRLDAYVWAAHDLIVQKSKKGFYIF
jgi:phage terminase large subunit-like protein